MELSEKFKNNLAKIIANEWLSDKDAQIALINLETEMEILRHKIAQTFDNEKIINTIFNH